MTPRFGTQDTARDKLPERSRRIFATIAKQHIEHDGPVSSLWVAQRGDFNLSSASVRNIMAELEQLGYVSQPHTSAGRVPTDRGYRCYVDLLLAAVDSVSRAVSRVPVTHVASSDL